MVIIVLMLLVIFVPVTLVGLPTSKIVVTVTNVDSERHAFLSFRIHGVGDEYRYSFLMPEEVAVIEYRVSIGDYRINVECRDMSYDEHQVETRSGSVSFFETEELILRVGIW